MIKSPAIKLSPPPSSLEMQDSVRQHIHRKAEIQKNKAKYTLTERDGSLLVTHALELQFQDGQTIVEAGHIITNVFRVKSGQVDIIKNGLPCCHLTQGFFIGDALLVNDDKSTYKMNVSLKANGPVTLLQLDLSFIKTLFSLDISLAMKFYHLLATKSASIFHQLVVSLNTPALLSSSLELDNFSNSDTASDTTNTATDSQLSTTPPQSACVNLVRSQSQTSVVRRNLKRISRNHFANDAYKVYQLMGSKHGIQSIRVKPKKLKIVTRSFGFVHKVSIEFARLNTITKVGDNGATIVYNGRKVNTIFFKNQHDLEEFMYLVASLTTPTEQTAPVLANRPISSPNTDEEEDEEDGQVSKGEDHFREVQTEVELKKGDKVFEEGDLFQRVYTLVSGTLAVYQNGVFLHNLNEGLVFGVDTILFLRPAPVTIEVVSETAELLVIPAYKMHELIDSDVSVALRLFKRAAQILDSQIGKILRVEQQIQGEVSRKSMELARSRSAVDVARRSQELERPSSSSQSMGLLHSASSLDIGRKQGHTHSSSQEFARHMEGGYTRSAAQEIARRTQELENASSQEISRMSPLADLHNSQSQEIARLPQDNDYDNSPSPVPAESKSCGVDSQGVVAPSQVVVGGADGL